MSSKTKPYRTPAGWFSQFPPIDPPGWDDSEGWCRRHFAPVAAITDPRQRATAQRVASMELMVLFASTARRVVNLPVPAREMSRLIRELAPVCCWLGDGNVQAVLIAAMVTAEHEPPRTPPELL